MKDIIPDKGSLIWPLDYQCFSNENFSNEISKQEKVLLWPDLIHLSVIWWRRWSKGSTPALPNGSRCPPVPMQLKPLQQQRTLHSHRQLFCLPVSARLRRPDLLHSDWRLRQWTMSQRGHMHRPTQWIQMRVQWRLPGLSITKHYRLFFGHFEKKSSPKNSKLKENLEKTQAKFPKKNQKPAIPVELSCC